MAIIDLKHCTLSIQPGDSDSSGETLTDIDFVMGEGNLSFTVARNIEYRLNAGSLTGSKVREGDEIPMEVSFEGDWETLATSPLNSEEEIYDTLLALNQSSDLGDLCAVASVDLVLTLNNTACPEEGSRTYTFPYFRFESMEFDASAGTISVSGKCRQKAPTFA